MNRKTKRRLMLLLVVAALIGVVIIFQAFVRKPESQFKLANIPAGEFDPAVWGKYYPLQYESYRKNLEMSPSPTGFGGSEKVQKSVLEPEILINFKGMAFSKEYTEDRGHPYAIQDLKETKRVTPASPGACMTCKTANLIDIYKSKGWQYAKTPLPELYPLMKHPIVCANCHDPATMNLRVVNPAFVEAMQRRGIDVKKATREEMRSYVCGQCHVEYYFEPESQKVVFPWEKGVLPEQMYAYYQERPAGFDQDWLHPDSQAKMLKAQHPEFETWQNSVHGKSGVSCADCHMPYVRKHGRKYTSHWVTSPMRTTKESCMTCHTQSAEWLLQRVKTIQGNAWQLQKVAGQAVARAHDVIGKAGNVAGVKQAELAKARELLRKAQWFWDIVAAENSMGFHNPDQVLNTLGQSIDMAHQAAATANKAANGAF